MASDPSASLQRQLTLGTLVEHAAAGRALQPGSYAMSHISEVSVPAMTHFSEITAATGTHLSEISAEAATHLSAITAPSTMHLSEVTAPASSAPGRGPARMPASSGAAATKREQLKRKALRDGFGEKQYINHYNAAKRTKRNFRDDWVRTAGADARVASSPPMEILRDYPQLHPRTNLDKVRAPGQRMYKKCTDANADCNMKLGESAVE